MVVGEKGRRALLLPVDGADNADYVGGRRLCGGTQIMWGEDTPDTLSSNRWSERRRRIGWGSGLNVVVEYGAGRFVRQYVMK